jgi:hypothetical protein
LLEPIQSDKVGINMKFFRPIAVMLIFVLASSPALAAICAASCASQSVMSSLSLHSNDMSGMQHCHEDSMNTDEKNTSNTEHKSCVMGSACHLTQITSDVDSLSKYVYADTTSATFSKFAPSDKSIDISPPLKPPA